MANPNNIKKKFCETIAILLSILILSGCMQSKKQCEIEFAVNNVSLPSLTQSVTEGSKIELDESLKEIIYQRIYNKSTNENIYEDKDFVRIYANGEEIEDIEQYPINEDTLIEIECYEIK